MRKFEIILALGILIGILNLVFGDGWLCFILLGVGIVCLIDRHRTTNTRTGIIAMPDAWGQRLPPFTKENLGHMINNKHTPRKPHK